MKYALTAFCSLLAICWLPASAELAMAKVGEYPFSVDGCGAIVYSGASNLFYVVRDHGDDGKSKVYPLTLGIDADTGAILSQKVGEPFTPGENRDSEGVAFDAASGRIWLADESGKPTVAEFDLSGKPSGRAIELPEVQKKFCRSNLSLESLAMSPDGLTMWTANEQALTCDGPSSNGSTNIETVVRLTRYRRTAADGSWSAAGEWAYACDACVGLASSQSGLSGLCALPDGSLLTLEREISVATMGRCRIYRLTPSAIKAATDVSGMPALTNATFSAVGKGSCLLDFHGSNLAEMIVYEGIALGPVLKDGSRAVYLVSDGGNSITRTIMGFTVTAKTASRLCALRLYTVSSD